MTDSKPNESLFTYLDKKAEELKQQQAAKKAQQQPKAVDPEAERRRHEADKRQGMI